MNAKDGRLIIFSAPSGAGKTTIVNYLLTRDLNLEFSVSACSREKRRGEVHGVDYYFLTVNDFKQKIAKNEFIEWEEVYHDHFYGTLKSEIDRIWNNNHHVIFDVDVIGGLALKKQFGVKALSIFVMPPSIESLEERLRLRETETPESIARRMGKAEQELKMAEQFDVVLHNNNLEQALRRAEELVKEFLSK
jgi:guanylate kinase